MSATSERDSSGRLAKTDPKNALATARKINDPWFRAQALSWVARFTDDSPVQIAAEAAKAAAKCGDDYKKSAVRAWEIAALAERELKDEARESLRDALELAKKINPSSSRSEALTLLLHAAFRVDAEEATAVYGILTSVCSVEEHWRCKRAVRDGGLLLAGELSPRAFFW